MRKLYLQGIKSTFFVTINLPSWANITIDINLLYIKSVVILYEDFFHDQLKVFNHTIGQLTIKSTNKKTAVHCRGITIKRETKPTNKKLMVQSDEIVFLLA